MKQSFEAILKEFATSVIVERDTDTSNVCVNWYDIVDGTKKLRNKNCNERMSEEEFRNFKSLMKTYHQIIEEV